MLYPIKMLLALLLCVHALCANEPRLIKLEPPQISSETISEQIVCVRPMREGKFNISLEQCNGKTIVNCYGHGGAGWTTLFGSVNKAIGLFKTTRPDLDTPIRVIGSGCMGLTTAIELARLGYNVKGISTTERYDIPSWKAGGYCALVSNNIFPEEQENLNEISVETFLTYQKIEQGAHPYLTPDSVRYLPVYCSAEIKAGVDGLEARGMIPPREYVSLDFGNGVIHHHFVKYMTYFMNTGSLMQQLTDEIARLNIDVEVKTIHAFDQVAEGVIFNCSGLGGRELNSDVYMTPVRGHLITLNAGAGSGHMDYMICTKVKQNGKDESIYMFPKNLSVTPESKEGMLCSGVLGGTFIPCADKIPAPEQEIIDREEFRRLLDRNSEFFMGHPFEE